MNERELLARLIAIPSVNPMGQAVSGPEYLETALTAYLEDWLRPLELDVRRQAVAPGRDNLLATYHAPGARGHVLLEVHLDTVPTAGMVIDPFHAKVEGNRLYGRGACDNKGPMTAMLLAMGRLARERPAGAASVTLALTVDEEHTFLGVQELMRRPTAYTCAIVAEPTDLDIVEAHKGTLRWEIYTHGRACHSSAPRLGINAIYHMATVLGAVRAYADDLTRRPEHPLLGGRTASVGRIEGGVAVNVVPDRCRIEVDRRLLPGEVPMEAHAEAVRFLRAALPDLPATVTTSAGKPLEGIPLPPGTIVEFREPWLKSLPLGNDHNGPLTLCLGRSIDACKGTHLRRAVAFGTDASTIAAAGVPAVVFGPGSITKAHTEDEWVPLDEVVLASEIYYHFCAHAESYPLMGQR